jgi:hypothetical protein
VLGCGIGAVREIRRRQGGDRHGRLSTEMVRGLLRCRTIESCYRGSPRLRVSAHSRPGDLAGYVVLCSIPGSVPAVGQQLIDPVPTENSILLKMLCLRLGAVTVTKHV